MKNTVFIIVIAALALTSCNPAKRLNKFERKHPELFKVSTKDSTGKTTVSYITHDSLIVMPAKTVTIHDTFNFKEDKAWQLYLLTLTNHKYVKTSDNNGLIDSLTIDSTGIKVTCHESEVRDTLKWKQKTIDSMKFIIKNNSAAHTVYAPKSTMEIIYTFWFWLCVVAIVLWVVYMIFKPKVKL